MVVMSILVLTAAIFLTVVTAIPVFPLDSLPPTEVRLSPRKFCSDFGECKSSQYPSFVESPFSLDDRNHSEIDLEKRASTYTVITGDTGYAIASRFSVSFEVLQSLNPNVNWNNLQIGQSINLSNAAPTTTYNVVAGDTGWSISQKLGYTFDALQASNPSVNWNSLQIGQALNIPGQDMKISSIITATVQIPTSQPIPLTTLIVLPITSTGPAPVPTDPPPTKQYSVVSGDTGNAIAAKFEITFTALQAVNSGVDWNNLQIGQVLKIPIQHVSTSIPVTPSISTVSSTTFSTVTTSSTATSQSTNTPSTYKVVAGDTGYGIATKHGIPFDQLSSANPGVTWTNLQIGQTLYLPGSGTNTPTPTTTPTARVTGPLAISSINDNDGHASLPDSYTFYSGSGTTWPSTSSWVSYAQMVINTRSVIGTNCVGGAIPNALSETNAIYAAIQSVAAASLLDHRFILAIIMQESNGCVRVPTTYSPAPDFIRNPGLMQSFMGTGNCNVNGQQTVPCPDEVIWQMVVDGAMGTGLGDGLVQALNRATGYGAQAFYQAARLYNSGSMPGDGDLGGPGATRCFASDVANRLTGWSKGVKRCYLDG